MYKQFLINQNSNLGYFSYLGHWWGGVIVLLIIWSLIWKGLALWKAARSGQTAWFIVFLVANTLGVLEILYIYLFSKKATKKGKK